MKRQQGFTIIELIVVIVVLGILAATAIPRFANVGTEARIASMQGVAGSMNSAKEVIRAKWYAAGSTTVSTVTTVDGTSVAVTSGAAANSGYPTAAGMVNALNVSGNISCAAAGNTTTCTPAGFAACTVTYDDTSGAVSTTGLVTANCGG
ncbi:MAG: prepilin-type N-terminal cleavage/methylation domain-containing protein [Burkholderiales bacterium]|nr:prepilin-type N-terminal cleavage/methylation domain-containing protein [Burkholderiales bacterium]